MPHQDRLSPTVSARPRRWLPWLVLLLGLWLGSAAHARPLENEQAVREARVHLEAGVLHFNAGRYEAAAQEMETAFGLRPSPEMQYNLAHCYERIGDPGKAINAYKGYLAARPGAPDRAEVESRLTQLSEKARATVPGPAEPAPPPLTEAARAKEAPAERVVFKTMVVYKEPPPKAGRSARIAALSLLGVAVAGLAAGVAFEVVAGKTNETVTAETEPFLALENKRLHEEYSSITNMHYINDPKIQANVEDICRPGGYKDQIQMERPDDNKFATSMKTFCALRDSLGATHGAAIVGFSVGGLAAAGALGFYLYSRRLDKKQAAQQAREQASQVMPVALLPTFSTTGGGLLVSGRF